MPINSRRKGQTGEREIVKLFVHCFEQAGRPDLVEACGRNLQQWERGGCDLVGIPFLSCEVKLGAKLRINQMREDGWKQCLDQASKQKLFPVLFWRADHTAWKVRSWTWLSLNGTGRWIASDYSINDFSDWYVQLLKNNPHKLEGISGI